MGFKKNNLNKSALIPNIIGATILCILFTLGIFLLKNTLFFDIKIDNINDLTNTLTNNIIVKKDKVTKNQGVKKEDVKIPDIGDKKINILLIGRGGGSHEAPDLTDTIILASINPKTKIMSMFSIPRDLYVKYPKVGGYGKINGLYASYKRKSKEDGLQVLKDKITQITGEKIDYYVNVDFEGFKSIIDTIGGIEITVPENFVDYQYPNEKWGYSTLVFRKGTWIFDGENALKYARSRHSTSDFDRSLRQQQVIKAIKDKVSGSYFLTSPGKVKDLYNVFIKNVDTDIGLTTLIKLAYNLGAKSDFKIVSSNLSFECNFGNELCTKGGFLYSPDRSAFGGLSVLLVTGTSVSNINNYDSIKKYTDVVFNYPGVFTENYKINIFNGTKTNNIASRLVDDIIKYGFFIPLKNSIGNADKIYDKSIIYYNNINENSVTIKALKLFFKGEFKKTETPMFSTDNANIEIIIGEDYKKSKKVFEF